MNGLTSWFGGLPFVPLGASDAADWVIDMAVAGQPGDVHYINAYTIALASEDRALHSCITRASANFADGRPISLLSGWLAGARIHQVRGPQAFESIMNRGQALGLRHYLLGSTQDTLERLAASLVERYPDVRIVGLESPPFRVLTVEEKQDQDARIRELSPDIVWVGLGTPKQDFEAQRLGGVGFLAVAVGAAFDFSAGTKREAPGWMRRVSIEWMYRLATEPRRLWRRYLFGNVRFLKTAWRQRNR